MAEDNKKEEPKTELIVCGIPEDLKMEFKVLCTRRDVSMSSVIVEFMRRFVGKGERDAD